MPGAAENRRTPPRSSPASHCSFGSTQSSSESEGRSKVAPRRQSFGNHSWSSNTPTRSTNFRRSRINSSSDTDSVERFAGARFSSPPSPAAVPLPPLEWLKLEASESRSDCSPSPSFSDELSSATLILKDILSFKA